MFRRWETEPGPIIDFETNPIDGQPQQAPAGLGIYSAVSHTLGLPTTMPYAASPAAHDTRLQDLDAERNLRVLRLLLGQLDEPL
jgi:hypothetical protein